LELGVAVHRRSIRVAALISAAALGLAACGGAEDPTVAAPPAPEPAAEDGSAPADGALESDEPLDEDVFELEPVQPVDDPGEDDTDREPLSAEELADLPDAPFAVVRSPVPGVPFPADYEAGGRSQDPVTSDYGFAVCTYRQEFETSESMQELADWFTALMPHHGYDVETDQEEVVGTDWFDADSPEFPGLYSVATVFPEEGGGTSGLSFEATVFDVEHQGHRSVYLQMQTVGECA
jgi:hypothetical protein